MGRRSCGAEVHEMRTANLQFRIATADGYLAWVDDADYKLNDTAKPYLEGIGL